MLKKILKVATLFTAVLTIAILFVACGKKGNKDSNNNNVETNGGVTLVSSAPVTQEQLQNIINDTDLIDEDLWQGLSVSLSLKAGSARNNLMVDASATVTYDKNRNALLDISEIGRMY